MACFAAVTCDLVTAPKAGSGTQFTFKLATADTLVVGTPVPIDIDVTQAGTALQGARLEIVSSNPNIIAVVDNSDFSHALNPVARGTAILTVRLLGSAFGDVPPSDTFAITAVAHAITATRGAVTMKSLNDTLTFGAKVFDGNNAELVNDESAVRWTSTSPNVVKVDAVTGKATALANGTAILKAAIDVDTAVDTVTVAQQVAHYSFSPSPVLITSLTSTAQITTTPRDSGGSIVTSGGLPTVSFTSRHASSISVNSTGLVTGILNDSAFIVATATVGNGTVIDSVKAVVNQVATSIFINQTGPINKDALNDTVLISASAFDAKNLAINSRSITFSSASPLVARLTTSTSTSTVLALDRTGSAKIFAQMDGAKDSITINVTNVARTLFVTPDTLRFTTVDDTIPLSILVRNSRGDTVPQAGSGIAWQSLDTTIATVDTAGRVWAHAVGTGRVRATIPTGVPDTSVIKVQNLATSVDLVPGALTLASIGDTVTIPTNIRNARNKQLGAASVQWSTTNQAVATVGTGFVTAQAAGTTFILAVDSLNTAHRDSVLVTVTNAPATVALDHHLDTLHALTTKRQFTATVRNARGVPTAQQTVTWSSSNTAVISVDASGNVTAQGVGTAFVRADTTFGGTLFRDSAAVVVQNDIDHLVVAQFPLASIASLLDTVTLQASAVNVLGGLVTGVAFRWTSSDSTIASVNHTTGLVTALQVGSVNITASVPSAPSVASVTTRVDISNLPTFVDITPTSITLANVNDTVLPAVTLKNKLGALLPRTAAQWVSDNPAVAFVTHDTVIAAARGVTFVRARNSISTQIQDSVLVTVTNAPATMVVTPNPDSLASLGRTKQMAVSVTNARGAPILNEPITWSSSNSAVLGVSATGLVSSIGIGQAYIRATAPFNGKTDSALIKVSNFAATVSITPGAASLAALNATQQLTATARNEAGGTIVGPTVTWTSSNPSIVAFLPSGTGSPVSGPAVFARDTMRVVAVATGTATITATVDNVPTSITVTVGNAPATIQITSPDTTLASIGDAYQSRITIQNALGNTLPNSAVTWTTSDQSVATVSSTGLVTAVGAGGPVTIQATSPADATRFSAYHVTVSNAPASLTIAPAGPSTLTAIGQTLALTATVRNAAGTVIASPNPAVTWSSNSAAVTVNAGSGVVTAAAAGSATITATSGAATLGTTVNVTLAASGAKSTIAAGAATLTANGVANTLITVQLKDANGVNLTTGGGTVTMTLTGSGSLGPVTNNSNGTYTATLTAPTTLGSGSVSASVNGQAITTGDPSVQYVAGAATKYIVTSSSNAPTAGSQVTISAQQADAFNNPVTTAKTVTWSSTGGGSFASPTSPTNGAGVATVTFTTNSGSSTTHTVTATDGSAVTGTSGAITTIAGVATNYLVTPSTVSPPAGTGVTITAQLRDGNNNPVSQPGQVVTWTKSNPGGSFSSPTSTTNANGNASVTFTTSSTSGTASTVTATTSAITGTSALITTVPSSPSAATTTISAGVGALNSGQTTGITVQAKDQNGNNLAGSGGAVTLSATRGSLSAVTDNQDGTYSATFTATSTGTATISGTIGGSSITSTASITVSAGTATQMTLNAGSGQSATVSTTVTTPPSVLLRDANNNPVPGQAVTFTVTGGGGTTSPASGNTVTTNASGIAALTSWTMGSTPGTNTVQATFAALTPVNFTATGTVGSPSTVTSTMTPSAGSYTAGNSVTITVQLKDAAGNNYTSSAGSIVAMTASPGGALTVTDNFNGTYTATLSRTTTGAVTVNGTISGNAMSASATVTVNAGAVSAAQTSASVPSGTAGTQTSILVQTKDGFGNNLAASSGNVIAASITGANTASGTVTDNLNGTYTIKYTPTTTGSDAVAITLSSTPISGSPYASVVSAGTAASFVVEQAGGGSIVSQTAGTSFNIRITAKDANGNTATSFTGTVDLTSTSTITAGGGTTGTFTAGVLSSRAITLTTAGSETITATKTGGGPAGTSNSFSVAPGAASAAQTTASVPAGNAGQLTTISIQAKDAFGNNRTSTSGTVTVSISSGPNSGATTTVTNNGDGTYTATYTPSAASITPDQITIKLAGTSISGSPYSSLVSAGGLDHFAVTATGGGNIASQTAGTSFNVKIVAQDASNNTVSSFSGTVTITSSGTLTGSPVTSGSFASGVLATQALTITSAGSATISVTDGTHNGTSNSFTVNPGALSAFVVEAVGGGSLGAQATGTSFNIQITAVDANGNTVTSFSGSAGGGHKAVLTSNATMTGAPITTGNFTNGVFSPQSVTITSAAAAATITATRSGGTEHGTSAAFQVIGAPSASTSTITVSSSTDSSGVAITATLHAKDAAGNTIATGGAVNIGFQATGGTSTGSFGTVTDNGDGTYSATFTGNVAGTATTIKGTVGGTPTTSSQSVTVIPGAPSAATSTITVSSGTVASGSSITVTLHGKDAAGNTITTGGATNISFAASTGVGVSTGTFGGAVTDNGDGTYSNAFTGVLAGTATTITGVVGVTNTTSSQAVTVTFGSLDHFDWSLTSPQTTAVAFTGTNTLTAKDAAGNTITNFDASANNVTVTLAGTGTVTGLGSGATNVLDQAANFVNGVADLAGKLTYTRSAAETSATFVATSAVGGKTGTSAPVSIGP